MSYTIVSFDESNFSYSFFYSIPNELKWAELLRRLTFENDFADLQLLTAHKVWQGVEN